MRGRTDGKDERVQGDEKGQLGVCVHNDQAVGTGDFSMVVILPEVCTVAPSIQQYDHLDSAH